MRVASPRSIIRPLTLRRSGDLQLLFTDGETFFHDERRDFCSEVNCVSQAALGFEMTRHEKGGHSRVRKTILGDPHQNYLLMHASLDVPMELLPKLGVYIPCAPHLENRRLAQ
jgi:glucoamylase